MLTTRITKVLRVELEDNPEVIGPWEVGKPAYVVFAENMGEDAATLHIKGGQTINGPFVRQYGSDTVITIPAKAKMIPAVITDIPKFIALHLGAVVGDGVRVELHTYYPVPNQDIATESLTVV